MGTAVFWLGAGYSKPVGGPLASELLDQSFAADLEFPSKKVEQLTALVQEYGGREGSVEQAFDALWSRARTVGEIAVGGERIDAVALLATLREYLAAVTAKIGLRRSNRSSLLYVEHFRRVANRSRSITIITTNYDLLAEQVVNDAGFTFSYGTKSGLEHLSLSDGPKLEPIQPGDVTILKIHGSCNWVSCDECGALFALVRPYLRTRRERCPRCKLAMLEVHIIPPLPSKEGEMRALQRVIQEAGLALSKATQVVVIGYSLPAVDKTALYLLENARDSGVFGPLKSELICGPDARLRDHYKAALPLLDWTGAYYEDYLRGRSKSWGIRP